MKGVKGWKGWKRSKGLWYLEFVVVDDGHPGSDRGHNVRRLEREVVNLIRKRVRNGTQ